MNPFIFCATTNTRKFTIDKLQYCVSHFANIQKIIYQPTCNFDYAFVHINEWKENSSFYDKIISNKKITNKIPVNKLKKLFNFSYHTKKINIIFKRGLKK